METGTFNFEEGLLGDNLPTGQYSAVVPAGWTLKGIDDPELVVYNESDVVVTILAKGRNHEVVVHINDPKTFLMRRFAYVSDGRGSWCPIQMSENLSLSIPPYPGRVLEKLKTAKFPVVLIDIESLAQSVNSCMTSIGAVCGDLITGEVFSWFQTAVPNDGQSHRKVDFATVKWWAGQYRDLPILARLEKLRTEPEPKTTIEALLQLTAWFESFADQKRNLEVFCNGPEFDSANLSSLYEHFGSDVPWQFRRNESVRTMVMMGRRLLGIDPKYKDRPGLVEHFALHDALREFQYCSEIYQCLYAKCQPLIVIDPATAPLEIPNESNLS